MEISRSQICYFQESLLSWYEYNRRNFYWRSQSLTSYQYIIAEVLLQRTKAETVAKFYPEFIKRFPDWLALEIANVTDIEEFLKPVGLYRQRASRLKKLASEMVKRNGALPQERSELEAIPFMGQYIANAVELIIFKKPSPLMDVNMARVLERYFGPRKLADIRYDPYLQNLAGKIVNHSKSMHLNWSILDFAALICQARKPKCQMCMFRLTCKFALNQTKQFVSNIPSR